MNCDPGECGLLTRFKGSVSVHQAAIGLKSDGSIGPKKACIFSLLTVFSSCLYADNYDYRDQTGKVKKMQSKPAIDIDHFEGRTFKIGRDGHIYINSPVVSQQHAEIRILRGKIYLRDLNSTNGTYLVKKNRLVYFDKGYVELKQRVVLGDQQFTIEQLLSIAGDFVASDDEPTELLLNDRVMNH